MSGEKAQAKKKALAETPDVGRTGAPATSSAPTSRADASGAPESAKTSAKAGGSAGGTGPEIAKTSAKAGGSAGGTEPESAKESTTREDGGGDKEAAKERFREALERKNAAAHRSATAARNTGSVHGSEVSGGGARMFRRKSG